MRFSWLGGYIQLQPFAEGGVLKQLGLLHVRESDYHMHVNSTARLRALFVEDLPMEDLYPVLVEFVMRFRHPELVDVASVERRLGALGMTRTGLDELHSMLADHFGFWDERPVRRASVNSAGESSRAGTPPFRP